MRHFTLPEDGGLITKNLPEDILHGYDRIYTNVYSDSTEGSRKLADIVVEAIKNNEKENPGGLFRLGLTTGATPASLYKVLSRYYREGKVSFKNVAVFSIDEYYPSSATDMQSRNRNLHLELLNNIDILPENIHIPNGTVTHDEVGAYCARFDAAARGLDLLIMGIGEQGQVGFNEAGSSEQSRTRTVLLSYPSRKRQARYFNGDISVTPKEAITMGISTMMSAKKVILMAWGETKAEAVARVVEGEIGSDCPASYFQHHPNVRMIVDEVSGSLLTRVVAPWLIGPCEWTPKFRRKAVIWLCQQVHKPILKLSHADYLQHSLEELLDVVGSYDQVNIQVFNDLQHTITGWPGGKPNADDSTRPVASKPFPKKVLILSPHPDDDVISMGGTFIRLVHQGHDVHVAYQTSGNVAVHDSVVMQHMDAAYQLGFGDRTEEVKIRRPHRGSEGPDRFQGARRARAPQTAGHQGRHPSQRGPRSGPFLRFGERPYPFPQSAILRKRRNPQASLQPEGCRYHQGTDGFHQAGPDLHGGRPCGSARNSPRMYRGGAGGLRAAQGGRGVRGWSGNLRVWIWLYRSVQTNSSRSVTPSTATSPRRISCHSRAKIPANSGSAPKTAPRPLRSIMTNSAWQNIRQLKFS